jgi:hypothetical protein
MHVFPTLYMGFDHGVGHFLLLLCDAKAPHGKNYKYVKGLRHYLFNAPISSF